MSTYGGPGGRVLSRNPGPVARPLTVVGSGVAAQTLLGTLAASGLRGVAGWLDPAHAARGSNAERVARAIAVLCSDVVDRPSALASNARCIERQEVLVVGWLGEGEGYVGSVVDAGEHGCLQCLDLRVQAATGRPALATPRPVDPDLARLVGKEVAAQVGRFVAGDPPTGGQLVRIRTPARRSCHIVRRSWECPACSPFAPPPGFCRRASTVRPGRSLAGDRSRSLAARGALVDPLVGPVRSLDRFEPGPRDPPLRHWVATLSDPGWARHGLAAVACGGTALDDDSARAAALGEALDRMSAPTPEHADLLVAPYRDVAADALDPGAWDLFDTRTREEPRFPFRLPGPDDPQTWVWGFSLTRSRPVLVPASRVFVPARARTAADASDHAIVSGFATGSTWEEAALAGTLEVIERDGFRIAWANRLSLPAVDLEGGGQVEVAEYLDGFRRKGLEVRCRLIVLDTGVPVVVAMVRSPYPDDPALVLSAAADVHVSTACRRALAELAANRLHARHAAAPDRDSSLVTALNWWEDAPSVIGCDEPEPGSASTDLDLVVDRLSGAGLDVIIVDLTMPWVADLGLLTVKALVPGSYPLPVDDHWPHLGGPRLAGAPVDAGLLDTPLPPDRLNRGPHPFP